MASNNNATKFGFINAWARGGEDGLEGLLNEYPIDDGIAVGGNISIRADQVNELVDYITDPSNMTEYGVKLDFAIFYKEDAKVKLGGSISTPYQKEGGGGKARTRAKRSL